MVEDDHGHPRDRDRGSDAQRAAAQRHDRQRRRGLRHHPPARSAGDARSLQPAHQPGVLVGAGAGRDAATGADGRRLFDAAAQPATAIGRRALPDHAAAGAGDQFVAGVLGQRRGAATHQELGRQARPAQQADRGQELLHLHAAQRQRRQPGADTGAGDARRCHRRSRRLPRRRPPPAPRQGLRQRRRRVAAGWWSTPTPTR